MVVMIPVVMRAHRVQNNAAVVFRRHAAAPENGQMAQPVLMNAMHPLENVIQTVHRVRNNATEIFHSCAIVQAIGQRV